MTESATRRSRAQLLLILLIAFGSLGGSYLLYHVARDAGVWGTTNQGEFVDPPVQVTSLGLLGTDGSPFVVAGTWWLMVVAPDGCPTECETALHQLRQLHVLLNKDAARVRRALVTRAGIDVAPLLSNYPRMEHLTTPSVAPRRGIYIVDPNGNLVLRYRFEDAGKPVLEDLKRLLKLSQIG